MYGTIARMKIKPGALPALKQMSERVRGNVKGYIGSCIYQMDKDSNEVYLVVMFNSKQEYFANADSPEQNAEYEKMVKYLSAEPEWHDGEVVFADMGK